MSEQQFPDLYISDRIRNRILELAEKTSKKEIAEKLQLTPSLISKWTNRVVVVARRANGERLCALLGLDYDTEIKRQMDAMNKIPNTPGTANIAGDNCGMVIQHIGENVGSTSFTPSDIVRRITACKSNDADKIAAFRVLSSAGIL